MEDILERTEEKKYLLGGDKMRIKRIIFAVVIYYLKQKEQRTIKQAEEFWHNGNFPKHKILMDRLDGYTKKRWHLSDFP